MGNIIIHKNNVIAHKVRILNHSSRGIKVLTPPSVIGTATYGATLTRVNGTYSSDYPIIITGNWQRDGVDIIGETGATYTLVDTDAGKTISWREIANNTFITVNTNSNIVNVLFFSLYTNSTSENDIRIGTKDGNPTTIHWGDGVVEALPNNVYVTHNYSPNYQGNVIIDNKDNIRSISITKGSWDIDLKDLPRGMTQTFYVQSGTNTIVKGDILDIPPNLLNFNITTSGVVYGDLANMPPNITSQFFLIGSNHQVTYTAGRVWQNISVALWIRPAVGVFTTAMVDNLLIDLDNSPLFTGVGSVSLIGNCGAASAVSAAAIASLTTKGKTVSVN